MNSQVTQESSLPFGVDLDDDVTVKLWNDGSITCIKYGGIGEQDEVPISKEGVAELVAWLNKHAVEHRVHTDAKACDAKQYHGDFAYSGHNFCCWCGVRLRAGNA